jgi:hypothetical protein
MESLVLILTVAVTGLAAGSAGRVSWEALLRLLFGGPLD